MPHVSTATFAQERFGCESEATERRSDLLKAGGFAAVASTALQQLQRNPASTRFSLRVRIDWGDEQGERRPRRTRTSYYVSRIRSADSVFPHTTREPGGRLFRVDLIVPVDSTFEVYSVPGGDSFAAVRLLDQPLRKGENNSAYFFLTESQIAAGAFVAYTGMPTGDYVITRIEARAVSPEKFQQ